jgi:tetratricopeptide (TPR) repeat protein
MEMADGSGNASPVMVLSGPGGVGKTTLAVEAGRRVAEARGLSLVHVDLRGMDPEPLDPATALFRLLKALGVGNRDLPDDLDGRAGQFRTLLEERPAVVVLDNARNEEQVRPLLPGAGRGVVLVTSRRLLTGLEGVARLPVPVLEAPAALSLLASIVGDPDGPRGEGLAELAALCGGLPLALRIIGNRLATRPAWTARQLADRLADSERRLERINAGDLQITAAFGMSYDQLTPDARRLCRRLALIPGPDFTATLASVLIGASIADTEDLLDELLELGLLTQAEGFRYSFHDLLRLFAADRLVSEEEAVERAALTRVMTDWLLDVAVAAGRWYEPGYGSAPADWDLPVDLSSAQTAAAWLQDEADNWFGAVRIAADQGWSERVVETAEAQHWFSDHWQQWPYWHELFALAASAAEQLGDPVTQATQLNYLSWAQLLRREHQLSAQTALRAARIAEQAGDLRQQAWGFQYAANALMLPDPAAALPHARKAERLFAQLGDGEGHLQSLHMSAVALIFLKRPREAVTVIQEAEKLARIRQPDPARQRIADICLLVGTKYRAMAHEELGEDTLAEQSYRQALADAEEFGLPHQQADLELRFGQLLHRLGRSDEAVPMLHAARQRFARLEDAEQVSEIDQLLERCRTA